jgi:hypothetical protein
VLLILLTVALTGCTKKSPEDIIAKVNSDTIGAKEFSESYLQVILYGNQFDSPENRLRHLNLLIDSYLLAQHGLADGTVQPRQLEQVREREERRCARELLFEQEVEARTPIPNEKALRLTFVRSQQKVHLKHLFAKTKTEIDSLALLLNQGIPFDTLAFSVFDDSLLKYSGGDLGWSGYDELDPFLEDTAFAMDTLHYSGPVESRFGWHILKLEDKLYNPLLTETDFEQARAKTQKRFLKHEQDKLYYRYVNNFMADKTALIHNPAWSLTVREIRKRFPFNEQLSPILMAMPYSPEFGSVPIEMKDIVDEPLISFPDETWTVRDFLNRLSDLSPKYLYGSLKTATELLIRDHFLYREAVRRGLDKKPAVNQAMEFHSRLRAGMLYRNALLEQNQIDPASIPEIEIIAVYDSLKNSHFITKQTFDYSALVVRDSLSARICDSLLATGKIFAEVIAAYGIPQAGILVSGRFKKERTELPAPYRQVLLNLSNNDISGWLSLNRHLLKLQRHQIETEYLPYPEVTAELRNTIARQRTQMVLYDSLQSWRKQTNIYINQERLKQIFDE